MKNSFEIVGIMLIIGLIAFGISEYQGNRSLSFKVSSIEKQIVALNETVKNVQPSQDQILTKVVGVASPAVVSVIVSKDIPQVEVQYINPFADRDIGIRIPVYRQIGTKKQNVGGGTGFLIQSDGYIVTNKHVVSDTTAQYVVLLSTGVQKTANVVYRDPNKDLSLLKIDGSGYPIISLGDSASLKLGQSVIVIGNALGEYNNSVSVGIISGLNRNIQASDGIGQMETLMGVIQTDAAINRGNSGGPLLDLEGKAVGVNVAMQAGANSIGFSIPINNLKDLLKTVLK